MLLFYSSWIWTWNSRSCRINDVWYFYLKSLFNYKTCSKSVKNHWQVKWFHVEAPARRTLIKIAFSSYFCFCFLLRNKSFSEKFCVRFIVTDQFTNLLKFLLVSSFIFFSFIWTIKKIQLFKKTFDKFCKIQGKLFLVQVRQLFSEFGFNKDSD